MSNAVGGCRLGAVCDRIERRMRRAGAAGSGEKRLAHVVGVVRGVVHRDVRLGEPYLRESASRVAP
jgi:hypothetical protein